MTGWLVQRRLPGIQGENGCWADIAPVDARTVEEAVEKSAAIEGIFDAVYRAQETPEFRKFRVREHRQTTTTYETVPND